MVKKEQMKERSGNNRKLQQLQVLTSSLNDRQMTWHVTETSFWFEAS
jgi:hypothetical protein